MYFVIQRKRCYMLVLLVEDFPQRPILSLSHASTHTQQPNQYNNCPTIDLIDAAQDAKTMHTWLETAATRTACCTWDP